MKCEVTLVIGILCIGSVLAQYDECGKREVQLFVKIIGGNVSRPGMWPWQVGIKKDNGKWCGGALIAPQWVLTAAHCFYVKRKRNTRIWYAEKDTASLTRYKVVAGDHDTNNNETTEQERIPLEIHIHPDFRYYPIPVNDIALIKLNRKVTLAPYVRTVCLPNEDLAKPGAFGTATGWGSTESGLSSPLLRHSKHKIQDNDLCNRTTKLGFNPTVMFCAGDGKGHSDTCSGDSGGSVVRRVLVNGQYRWVTIGIVSWGEGCAVPGKYGYYTRLQPFMEWILLKTNSLCMDLGPPRNGLRTPAKRLYQHNDTVTFQCDAGYTRMGKAILTCQPDGTWDGYQPLCLAPCSAPNVPLNGIRLGNNFKHGKIARFRCKQGYQMTGASIMTCINGRWNKKPPICLAPCLNPGIPFNGKRLDHSFFHGDKVRFSCRKRYKMVGGKPIITCSNGRWDYNTPHCMAPCSNPGEPLNGTRLDHSFLHNDKVRFSCKKRYTMESEHTITCKDGRWDNKTPKCLAPCLDPGIPLNGKRLDHSFLHNNSVRFSCNKRSEMIGVDTIRCNDGRWDHNAPKCLGINIDDPVIKMFVVTSTIDREWDKDYALPLSKEYRELKKKLEESIKRSYKDSP